MSCYQWVKLKYFNLKKITSPLHRIEKEKYWTVKNLELHLNVGKTIKLRFLWATYEYCQGPSCYQLLCSTEGKLRKKLKKKWYILVIWLLIDESIVRIRKNYEALSKTSQWFLPTVLRPKRIMKMLAKHKLNHGQNQRFLCVAQRETHIF